MTTTRRPRPPARPLLTVALAALLTAAAALPSSAAAVSAPATGGVPAAAQPAVGTSARPARRYAVVKAVPVKGFPFVAAIDPGRHLAYFGTEVVRGGGGGATVVAVDLRSRRVVRTFTAYGASKRAPAGVSGLTVDPSTHRVYALVDGGYGKGPNMLAVFSPAGRRVAAVGVGRNPFALALDVRAHRAYVGIPTTLLGCAALTALLVATLGRRLATTPTGSATSDTGH